MNDEEQIADLEKQVGELEAQVEGLEKRESDSLPDSREVVKPKKGKKPCMKLHDNKATHMTKGSSSNGDDEEDDDDEDDMEKAKKKPPVDDEEDDDDMEKARKKKVPADDSDDSDGEDNWSEHADAKKSGKVKKEAPSPENTLVFKGQTIHKSRVGATQFGLLKALTIELQDSAAKLAKAEDEALMANMRKRADDEFPHVPGTVDQRALMLKVVGGLTEDMRKSFEAVFKSAEKLSKSAFATMGVSHFKNASVDDVKKNADDFLAKVAETARTDKITKDAAMQKVRKAHPDLFKAFQGQN
jgi:hypothetical protein